MDEEFLHRMERDILLLKNGQERHAESISDIIQDVKATKESITSIRIQLAQWGVIISMTIAIGSVIAGYVIKQSLDAMQTAIIKTQSNK